MQIDERLFEAAETAPLRRAAARILERAVAAVDPYAATLRAVRTAPDGLAIGGRRYAVARGARVLVVGAGKAGAPMARAAEDAAGGLVTGGLVVARRGYAEPPRRVALREAGHPLPDGAGAAAAEEILQCVSGLGPGDLVICLVSGGGSALLPLPVPGVTLDDFTRTTDLLLRSGAAITELNTVRKHLSRIAGGRLAQAAAPARVATLVLSDIVGSPLDGIASGPTVPDPTTYVDALLVLAAYGLTEQVPETVLDLLRRGAAGAVPETPKPGDPTLGEVHATVVADNLTAVRAAAEEAARLGFGPLVLTSFLEGEARHAGRVMAAIARQIAASGEPVPRPACVVAGGETTVTVAGPGTGGRNQELALAAALALDGVRDVLVVGFGTDGSDGPTDAAGAMADGTTLARARARGLDPAAALARNDAYRCLDALGDLIRTGPTNTNVADLVLILSGAPEVPKGRRRHGATSRETPA